jgi:thermostable 8-oxoguanine DNA glycosylase
MSDNQQWLQLFEQVSCFYRQMLLLPSWGKYPNHSRDIWDSLAIFLGEYAFERQGRRPDYFHAAVDALFWCKQQNNGNLTQNVISDIWRRFSELLNNQNLNEKNNPLYPNIEPENKRLSKESSVIEVVINRDITPSFTTYLQNQINQGGNIQNAFNLLKSIRGVGDKVASFYLRDLVDVMNINLDDNQRHVLQPIDIWVKRTVSNLTANQTMNREKVAEWIVKTAIHYNINPERVNMGIWFFCSRIVGSEYKLNMALADFNSAQKLVNDFRRRIQNVCQNC